MGFNRTKNSDEYKKEIDKLTSTTTNNNNTNNAIDQHITSEKIQDNGRDTKESKIHRKNESIKDKIFGKMSKVVGSTKMGETKSSSGMRSIIFGLFVLVGFIILVYSIFVAVIDEPLASIADTVFIAGIIGSFTLIGIVISPLFIRS